MIVEGTSYLRAVEAEVSPNLLSPEDELTTFHLSAQGRLERPDGDSMLVIVPLNLDLSLPATLEAQELEREISEQVNSHRQEIISSLLTSGTEVEGELDISLKWVTSPEELPEALERARSYPSNL